MNCRLSGTWRAKTEKWVNKTELPVINGMYDIHSTGNAGNKTEFIHFYESGFFNNGERM